MRNKFVILSEAKNLKNQKFLLNFLLLFAFAKRRVPFTFTYSNLPSKADSQNLTRENKSVFASNFAESSKKIVTNNRRGGGVAFVFVRIFGLQQTSSLVESPKIFTSVNRIPKTQIEKPVIAESKTLPEIPPHHHCLSLYPQSSHNTLS